MPKSKRPANKNIMVCPIHIHIIKAVCFSLFLLNSKAREKLVAANARRKYPIGIISIPKNDKISGITSKMLIPIKTFVVVVKCKIKPTPFLIFFRISRIKVNWKNVAFMSADMAWLIWQPYIGGRYA
ncbi:hypothetical protein LF817_16150 [Halobacillus sp. A1]|uniref:hypothetical protein n=1 Tax=Halobacillus sp. A1 TaxID=2880262 RepID=UPI0020A68637|nr:hypothetical protein [Halobacillus sp. A1]MCP3032859.1 hypothetical protein [Halobacillus sp. A1]